MKLTTTSIVITWITTFPASSQKTNYKNFFENISKRRDEIDGTRKEQLSRRKDRLLQEGDVSCDLAFLKCLSDESCVDCFTDLDDNGVNWAGVTVDTPCSDVLELLNGNGHCKNLKKGSSDMDIFCSTLNSCGIWSNEDDMVVDFLDDDNMGSAVDCDSLKKCSWEGMHQGFIGDGICQDYSCYNTKICDYDGGDCCPDTCESTLFAKCGDDHFFCRNPDSNACNVKLLPNMCAENATTPEEKQAPSCDYQIYRLWQYDSFGDGWDYSVMKIFHPEDGEVYSGSLQSGYSDYEYLCLKPGCYQVALTGGVWGNEVSWEIAKNSKAGIAIAHGGAPMQCEFPIGGDACDNTCNDNYEATYDDDAWNSYENLSNCLETTCLVQLGVCSNDNGCKPCLIDESPAFCYTNDNYNALVDCALCNCMEDTPSFCNSETPDKESFAKCTSQQTLNGAASIFDYSKCSNIDSVQAMEAEWDENNFGALDQFESCSHSFMDEFDHGSKSALDCMRILANIIKPDSSEAQVVQDMAIDLYTSGQEFCDCTTESHKKCPPCKDFMHFKTLLYESMDACTALDEIDCPSWSEFYEPCKKAVIDKFGSVDLKKKEQCTFMEEGCGGVGPFPAFRRLDCGKEISKSAWDFYISYQRGCTQSTPTAPTKTPPSPKTSTPAPSKPIPTPNSPISAPTKPYGPPSDGPKPYVPASDTPPYSSSSSSKRHPFFWFFLLSCVAGAGYMVYQRRMSQTSFDFVQYNRQRNYAEFGGDMGNSLTDATSSWSFEPPSLPPTPNSTNAGSYMPVQQS